jgi:predicted unusual protein kinase regulating ubiquinone biosynthesis (AarF/ABC1/UbiB family)
VYQAALRTPKVRVSLFRVMWRFVRISAGLAYFAFQVFLSRFSSLDLQARERRNAVIFRETLESLGGVLIKVGQQMSQRPDILPAAYCDELLMLLRDLAKKIPVEAVEAAIKRQTGKSIDEVFFRFDWDPVGSASVACVYKAVLHNGDEVAVKIRRPGIEKQFTADVKVLSWIMKLVEFVTIWRPGMTDNFRIELRDLLMEELDFRREARYQELFRRYHKRRKKLHVTAPKVYYKYSGSEVMVTEFITGIRVSDILDAIDRGDKNYLAELKELGIEPKRIAKRLVRSRYYSFHECPLFHGDPHPANIMVQPNNRVIMIDFGACGVFSERDRNLMWQLNQYYAREDVAGMVNMVLSIMEPIDPVRGIHQFKKDLLDAWWTGFYGIKSNHAEWWERSSFRLWLKYFELIRYHQIPIPRNMVRMIRATLLYDTVAARLYGEINVFKEFEKYSRDVARRARIQIVECAVRQMLLGPDDSNFLKFRQITNVANGVLFRLQKFLDDPALNLSEIAGKVYSAIRSVVRAIMFAIGAAVVGGVGAALIYVTSKFSNGESSLLPQLPDGFKKLLQSLWDVNHPYRNGTMLIILLLWVVFVAVLFIVYGRRIYLRFGDVDD